jgi:hypothetical protein
VRKVFNTKLAENEDSAQEVLYGAVLDYLEENGLDVSVYRADLSCRSETNTSVEIVSLNVASLSKRGIVRKEEYGQPIPGKPDYVRTAPPVAKKRISSGKKVGPLEKDGTGR